MKKLFIFVILLLVVGVSSMAAGFYHGPRYMNEEFHHYNSRMYERTYNKNSYPTNYKYDNYYNGGYRSCCR